MYFSVYEVAKANRLDPRELIEFAMANMQEYHVEPHAWGELVVEIEGMNELVRDFSAQFPQHCNLPPDGEDDPHCEWNPLDRFMVDREGKRVWSEGNPKWVKPPPKRRLP
ncbi:hypothetical protein G4G28_21635 [Massilia sp. Dwa41.01b]|uniref:hypothetical protein n=1 Tax=unclassified Massilia TaxID=2609279 RepID=UPI001602DF03|nr:MULTISPECIES: hypothetical protein [unclassified Massilia]QNA90447.1 hypothetical protein G4G28_21635 [Massilia sp. Dwa41.01b]QNA97678.1 hypothetical protein G4G31_00720 [Massilia sp. Se16.2.3]